MNEIISVKVSACCYNNTEAYRNKDNFYINGKFIREDNKRVKVMSEQSASYASNQFAILEGQDSEFTNIAAKQLERLQKMLIQNQNNDFKKGIGIEGCVAKYLKGTNNAILQAKQYYIDKNSNTSLALMCISNDKALITCLGNCEVILLRDNVMHSLAKDKALMGMGQNNTDLFITDLGLKNRDMSSLSFSKAISVKKGDLFVLMDSNVVNNVSEVKLEQILKEANKNDKYREKNDKEDQLEVNTVVEKLQDEAISNGICDNAVVMAVKVSDIHESEKAASPLVRGRSMFMPAVIGGIFGILMITMIFGLLTNDGKENVVKLASLPQDSNANPSPPAAVVMANSEVINTDVASAAGQDSSENSDDQEEGTSGAQDGAQQTSASQANLPVDGQGSSGSPEPSPTLEPTPEPTPEPTEEPVSTPAPTPVPTPVKTATPTKAPMKTAAPNTSTAVVPSTHTIQKGDSLDKISIRYYGSTKKVNEIMSLNGLKNKDVIIAGTVLKLPRP